MQIYTYNPRQKFLAPYSDPLLPPSMLDFYFSFKMFRCFYMWQSEQHCNGGEGEEHITKEMNPKKGKTTKGAKTFDGDCLRVTKRKGPMYWVLRVLFWYFCSSVLSIGVQQLIWGPMVTCNQKVQIGKGQEKL